MASFTVVIGEEQGTKIKSFLIAPEFTRLKVGDIVTANNVKFRVVYMINYCDADSRYWEILNIALGTPIRIGMICRNEIIDWEVEHEN